MNPTQLACLGILAALPLLVSACASSSGAKNRYPVAHSGIAHKLEQGTVVSVQEVIIDGQATLIGTSGGAAVGSAVGIAASGPIESTGDYQQAALTGAVAGVVGAVVGRQVEKQLTQKKAQELTIKLDSGEMIIVVQERREPPFGYDDRVQVYMTKLGNSRVFHADEDPYVDPETNVYIPDDAEIVHEQEPVRW